MDAQAQTRFDQLVKMNMDDLWGQLGGSDIGETDSQVDTRMILISRIMADEGYTVTVHCDPEALEEEAAIEREDEDEEVEAREEYAQTVDLWMEEKEGDTE